MTEIHDQAQGRFRHTPPIVSQVRRGSSRAPPVRQTGRRRRICDSRDQRRRARESATIGHPHQVRAYYMFCFRVRKVAEFTPIQLSA